MKTLVDRIAHVSLLISIGSLLGMVGVQAWQVIGRYVLNDSPGWTEPVALMLMNTAMVCAAALGVRNEAHFRFTLLLDRLSPSAQGALLWLSFGIAAGLGALLAYGGTVLFWSDRDVPMAGSALPEGARYLPLMLGGLLMMLFAVEKIVARFGLPEAGQRDPELR